MSNQPKAKWTCDGENYWSADVGTYRLEADPNDGDWNAYVLSGDYQSPSWNAEGYCETPCDVVTLMLAAESALATHLRSVADTMTWPKAPVAEPAPYAYSAPTEIGRQMREAWEKDWPEVSKLARCIVLPLKERDITNLGQNEIYVGGSKLAFGEALHALAARTSGTWAWAKQQMYAGAQVRRRDHWFGARVLESADLGVFDNVTDHAATDWEVVK